MTMGRINLSRFTFYKRMSPIVGLQLVVVIIPTIAIVTRMRRVNGGACSGTSCGSSVGEVVGYCRRYYRALII